MTTGKKDHIDAATLQRLATADAGAIERTCDFIYARVSFILGPGSADVGDVTTDAYLRILNAVAGNRFDFDRDGSASAWAAKIAVRVALDHRRKSARCHAWSALYGDEAADIPDDGSNPERELLQAQTSATVRALRDQLDADHREVLILRYWEDMSQDQIAEVLQIPVGTVKSRLHRAERRLHAALTKITQSAALEPEAASDGRRRS